MFRKLYYILLLFVIVSCSTNNRIISKYEQNNNSIKISSIKNISNFSPFYAKDSLNILDSIYKQFYKLKLITLTNQLKQRTEEYDKGLTELKTISNKIMVKVYNERLSYIKEDIDKINNIIYIYNNNHNIIFQQFEKQKNRYINNSNTILGYKLTVIFEGKQGKLPSQLFQHTYLFNKDKTQIITEL